MESSILFQQSNYQIITTERETFLDHAFQRTEYELQLTKKQLEETKHCLQEMEHQWEDSKIQNHRLQQENMKLKKEISRLYGELSHILYEFLPSSDNNDLLKIIPPLNKTIEQEIPIQIGSSILNYTLTNLIGTGSWSTVYEAILHERTEKQDSPQNKMIKYCDMDSLPCIEPPVIGQTTDQSQGPVKGSGMGIGLGMGTGKVAIKIIQKSKYLKLHSVRRFCNEIQALKTIKNCVHVIQLCDILQSPNYLFIVTEKFGCDMVTWLEHSGYDLAANKTKQFIGQIIYQLSSAIQVCHQHNIIHRDIKPDNILIEQKEDDTIQLKLCDFGLCELSMCLDKVCGTLGYIAPELMSITENGCTTTRVYGKRTDVWSFGCVILHCIKGTTWFLNQWASTS